MTTFIKYKIIGLILIATFSITLCGCTEEKVSTEQFESRLSKQHINIPYKKMKYIGNDSSWLENAEYINLYIMDSLSCSYCLANKVFYWKEFENNMKARNKNSHFCLIVYGNENTCNLINKVFYYTQLNVPTFVDTAMCFIKENKILDSIPKLSSMFIDKNGKVLLTEDPTANDRVMNNIYDLISQ